MIFSHFNVIIFIIDFKYRSFKLSNNRDFLFESQKFDILSIYAYIVDYNMLKIFIKNNIDYIMSLSRKVKLKIIINYEIIKCYVINSFKHNLIMKTLKRLFNWIKLKLYKFIIIIIIFIVIMIFIIIKEMHITKITLYNMFKTRFSISIVINEFSLL